MLWTHVALVALGGAIGSASRYLLAGAVHQVAPSTFPYGTFVVNVIGCLAFGLLAGVSEERALVLPPVRVFLLVGILGGFTTFSSFTYETFSLMRDGQVGAAFANAAGQVLVGFAALWAGYVLTRIG